MSYNGPESSILEYKRSLPENDQIIKTVIGFCNRSGGQLVIGVDSAGKIIGVQEDEIQKVMEYLNKSIYEASSPPIIPSIYMRRIKDKVVLVIEVSSGMNKPYHIKSKGLDQGTYIRLGRSTVKATADMIEELKWQSAGKFFDSSLVYHATQDVMNETKIANILYDDQTPLSDDVLYSFHLIENEHAKVYPTAGGVLLFGKTPQRFFPEAMIICTHFAGIKGRDVIATIDAEGTLFEQFNTAYAFIKSRLSTAFKIEGPKRTEELEIPEIAIREILLNAIIHRNYHIQGPTKVAIYDNRLEIFSPGVFPGPLTVENLTKGITYIRNPTICKSFRKAGYIEKLGSGFMTLFQSYHQRKLPRPQVIEGENFVKCILPRATLRINPEKESDFERILSLFEAEEELKITDIINQTGLSRATCGRKLRALVDEGKLVQIGEKRGVRYRRSS